MTYVANAELTTRALLRRGDGLAAKLRWHLNAAVIRRPWLLNLVGARLTVFDVYGAPGDTLLTATLCRHLRQWYPRLRLNCVTRNPDLLMHDPNIDSVNEAEAYFSVWSWYPGVVGRRDGETNVLRETFERLGLRGRPFEYAARVYLTHEERAAGRQLLEASPLPILTFHTLTNQEVKNWSRDRWHDTLCQLRDRFHLVHLGDGREPVFDFVQRLAGTLTLRESMSVLSHAAVHIGGDSFLMHAANGLGIPSVIIFGGSRTPANVGYPSNANLFAPMACGPCWIHANDGERCDYDVRCMQMISPAEVIAAVDRFVAAGCRQ
jgi:ADP-heptose:LPS heptosyltransferase